MSASDFDRKNTTVRESFRGVLRRESEEFLNAPEVDAPRKRYTKKLLRRIRRRQNGTDRLLRGLAIAGIALVATLALTALLIAAVPAWRAWFEKTFLEPPPVVVSVGEGNPPTQLPSHYKRSVSEIRADGSYYEEYTDKLGRYAFMFIQTVKGDMKTWISESMTATPVVLHGRTVYLFRAEDGGRTTYTLVWEDGTYAYCLRGAFRSPEELLAIAESVPFQS